MPLPPSNVWGGGRQLKLCELSGGRQLLHDLMKLCRLQRMPHGGEMSRRSYGDRLTRYATLRGTKCKLANASEG